MDSIARTALTRTYPDHRWREITHGTTSVWKLDGAPPLYVKLAPIGDSLEPGLSPLVEADRTRWLTSQGIQCADVIDAGLLDDEEYLVTTAMPGLPLSAPWPPSDHTAIIDAVAHAVTRLHRLPTDQCPFDRRLRVTIPMAQEAAGLGEVDPRRFDPSPRGLDSTTLVTELLAKARLVGREEPVVCHGNLAAGNILIDPRTRHVTAVISNARCGTADRYSDLAKITSELAAHFSHDAANRFIYRYGENPLDPERLEFYRLLDRFW